MRIGDRVDASDDGVVFSATYDFAEKYAQRMREREKSLAADEVKDSAVREVEEARKSNDRATFQMMDRHNELVAKSQELYKAKAKQQAIERRDKKHREEQRELLAEMALRNAQRSDLLEAARLKAE
jgi:hypothetical protein